MRHFLLAIAVVPVLALTACVPRTITALQPDAALKTNKSMSKAEKSLRSTLVVTAEDMRKTDVLFADSPDYAVIRQQRPASEIRLPRVRSLMPPPSYRINLKATVRVAFIVDERGKVVEAHVLESSDSRFDKGTVAAIKQWTFYPGTASGSPAKFLLAQPIVFAGLAPR